MARDAQRQYKNSTLAGELTARLRLSSNPYREPEAISHGSLKGRNLYTEASMAPLPSIAFCKTQTKYEHTRTLFFGLVVAGAR